MSLIQHKYIYAISPAPLNPLFLFLTRPTKMDDDDSNSKMGEKYKWEMDPYLAAVVNTSGKYKCSLKVVNTSGQ